jgi:hypothetical protein
VELEDTATLATSTGWLRSTPSAIRMNFTPNGVRRARGPRTSRKKITRCASSSSVALICSPRRRTVIVARPAARKLRTQLTSPQGANTQRRPETSMIATGVVRGRPPLRPRIVMSPLGPSGNTGGQQKLQCGTE